MSIKFHKNQHQPVRSNRADAAIEQFIKYFDIELNFKKHLYICEPHTPTPVDTLETTFLIKNEIQFIDRQVLRYVNAGDTLLIMNPIEVNEYDYQKSKLLFKSNNIEYNNVRLLNMSSNNLFWTNYWPSYLIDIHAAKTQIVRSVNLNIRNKIFTCLNRVDKVHRKYIVSEIVNNGIVDNGYVSYGNLHYEDEYDGAVIDYRQQEIIDITDVRKLSNVTAMSLKADNFSSAQHNDHSLIQKHFFNDAYWNFVTETAFEYESVITEKTFKPIANLQPFVVVGSCKTLLQLKKLGFRTFGNYIDESYDLIEDNEKRLKAVVQLLLQFNQMSHKQHVALMRDIKPILEFNQHHFFNPTAIKQYLEKIIG